MLSLSGTLLALQSYINTFAFLSPLPFFSLQLSFKESLSSLVHLNSRLAKKTNYCICTLLLFPFIMNISALILQEIVGKDKSVPMSFNGAVNCLSQHLQLLPTFVDLFLMSSQNIQNIPPFHFISNIQTVELFFAFFPT